MKKSLVLASLVLGVSAFATDSWFVGADLVSHNNSINGEATVSGTTYSGSESDTYTSPSLKLGKINEDRRIYVNYSTSYSGDETYYNLYYESLDFNYDILGDEISGLRPFYGAHIGLGALTFETNITSTTENGLEYGLQAGILKEFNENSSLEVGAKYTKASADMTFTAGANTATLSADSRMSLYIGYNYKF
jgi:hypothetical protein